MSNIQTIRFDQIDLSPARDARAKIRDDLVEEYADAYLGGADLGRGTVFFDGTQYWLADGLHRTTAARKKLRFEAQFDVHRGGYNEAFEFACRANDQHGGRTSIEDKRARAERYWKRRWDAERPSDRVVAIACNVSHTLAGAVRRRIESNGQVETVSTCTVGRDGKKYSPHGTGKKTNKKKETPTKSAGGSGRVENPADGGVPGQDTDRQGAGVASGPAGSPAVERQVETVSTCTASDLLPTVSRLHADLRKVTETTDGEPFDGKAASIHTAVLADLLSGEAPKWRLAKAGDIASQAAEIFDAYPADRKVGRDKALVAIRNGLKRVPFEELLEAVQAFAKSPAGNNGQFTPHPATWFGEGRWADDRRAWQLAGNGSAKAPRRIGPGERFDPTAELGSL